MTAAQTLRELIQESYVCSQNEENMIFEIARKWGDRRAKYEREACAKIAETQPFIQAHDDDFDTGVTEARKAIAAAIRNQSP